MGRYHQQVCVALGQRLQDDPGRLATLHLEGGLHPLVRHAQGQALQAAERLVLLHVQQGGHGGRQHPAYSAAGTGQIGAPGHRRQEMHPAAEAPRHLQGHRHRGFVLGRLVERHHHPLAGELAGRRLRVDHQHGRRAEADHLLGDRPDELAEHTAAAVGRQHHQVAAVLGSVGGNALGDAGLGHIVGMPCHGHAVACKGFGHAFEVALRFLGIGQVALTVDLCGGVPLQDVQEHHPGAEAPGQGPGRSDRRLGQAGTIQGQQKMLEHTTALPSGSASAGRYSGPRSAQPPARRQRSSASR
jgi:hypothetical protein